MWFNTGLISIKILIEFCGYENLFDFHRLGVRKNDIAIQQCPLSKDSGLIFSKLH